MAPRKGKHQHSSSITASKPPESASRPDDTDAYIHALNLGVLNKHDNEVVQIVYRAHYAVVYVFASESQQWEKSGIEGSIFICQLTPNHESMARYKVICLNRRGLDNFNFELGDDDQIEFTDELIIFNKADDAGVAQVYGIWIFFEPEPSSTSTQPQEFTEKLKDALDTVQKARELNVGNTQESQSANVLSTQENNGPLGQRLSLSEIFGQPRQQGATWPGAPAYQQSPGPVFAQTPGNAFGAGTPGQAAPVHDIQHVPGLQHMPGYQPHFQQQQQYVQQQHVQATAAPLGTQQQHLLGLFHKAQNDHLSPSPF